MLTINEKLNICELASTGMSYSAILEHYEIGQSMIADIRKNEVATQEFQ